MEDFNYEDLNLNIDINYEDPYSNPDNLIKLRALQEAFPDCLPVIKNIDGEIDWRDCENPLSDSEVEQLVSNYKVKIAKSEKLSELKNKFINFRNNSAVMHSTIINKDINARQEDIINIDNLIEVLPEDTSEIQFRCADNSFATVTKTDLVSIKQEIIQFGIQVYQKKWTLEQQIQSAENLESLENIEIDFP